MTDSERNTAAIDLANQYGDIDGRPPQNVQD